VRIISIGFLSLGLATLLAAQAPPKPAPAATRPDANLSQLMRGVFFPNSNNIFATQQMEPAEVE
jgi:hypothetical protein